MQGIHVASQTLGLSSEIRDSAASATPISTAFREVCETELRGVYRYVRYRVSSADTADELTAQTFLKALDRLDTFDAARGDMRTWIFGVARNVVRDYFRARRRWTWLPIDWVRDWSSASPGPESAAIADELQRELAAALTRLSRRERDLLGLKFGGSLTNRAIASITGLREGHVGVVVYRALAKLRAQLEMKGVRRG